MGNGTDSTTTCGVCGSSVTLGATTCSMCGAQVGASVPTGSRPPEEATNLLRVREDAHAGAPSSPASPGLGSGTSGGSSWPDPPQSGLPSRIPRQDRDEESLRAAFTQSWETSSEPAPVTRPPFTPTYLTDPPRPRRALSELTGPNRASEPAEPAPEPGQPEPPKPGPAPAPPAPEPLPTPFPTPPSPGPSPAPPAPSPIPPMPIPPSPMPPSPIPPMPPMPPMPEPSPMPPAPPNPVPTPPRPFPAPPPPVPAPAVIGGPPAFAAPPVIAGSPASPSLYQGGHYGELETQSITGFVVGPAVAAVRRAGALYSTGAYPTIAAGEPSAEMSGSLSGHILARGLAQSNRRERRHRLRSAMWIGLGLLLFMTAIAVIVDILAGDFISSIFKTFAGIAG